MRDGAEMSAIFKRILCGLAASIASAAIFYLIAAFVAADIGWMRNVFTEWTSGERAFFLYIAVICVGGPGLLAAICPERRH